MWVKEAGVVIPSRLLAFSLLGFVLMLATGCAGKTGTVQPQGLSDAKPVVEQPPAPPLRHCKIRLQTNCLILLPRPMREPVRSMIPGNR